MASAPRPGLREVAIASRSGAPPTCAARRSSRSSATGPAPGVSASDPACASRSVDAAVGGGADLAPRAPVDAERRAGRGRCARAPARRERHWRPSGWLWPAEPSTAATDENSTKKSSGSTRVSASSRQPPLDLWARRPARTARRPAAASPRRRARRRCGTRRAAAGPSRANPRKQRGQRGLVGDVERLDDHRAFPVRATHRAGRGFRRDAAPADQHEPAGAALGQPLRDRESEAGESAGDEVGAVARGRHGAAPARWRTTILPAWRALRHEAERALASSSAKTWRGSGVSAPVAQLGHQPLEHVADERRIARGRLAPVDDVIAMSGRAPSPRRILDAALADLHEAAARGEHAEAGLDVLAGQRVQDDVDAAPPVSATISSANGRARIEHVLDAHVAQQLALPGRASGREHLGARALRQLHGRHADAARCGMNQDALAGA